MNKNMHAEFFILIEENNEECNKKRLDFCAMWFVSNANRSAGLYINTMLLQAKC